MNRTRAIGRRALHSSRQIRKEFKIPSGYKPNSNVVPKLPLSQCFNIWSKSYNENRLKELQDELIELMIPSSSEANTNIKRETKHVAIDNEGNFINEVCFEIINDPTKETKSIVFIHGYGASLGCFARNFQIINKFKEMNYNYKIHFLDNISFGLSSNPQIDSLRNKKIERCPELKINNVEDATDNNNLYNKYYKLTDYYEIDADEFKKYQEKFTPILHDIESYYLTAIENWRTSSNLKKIDYLIGHSYGGYWSASYSLKYPDAINNLILLSPVGVERHVHAITNSNFEGKSGSVNLKPTLDPTSYHFLSRWPLLSKFRVSLWYLLLPYVPFIGKLMGPLGFRLYYNLWYPKLFKINKMIAKKGGAEKLFTNSNDLVYGTNTECRAIIEYLYNSVTNGTNSDYYIKYLLTPSTVSKVPLYDKFCNYLDSKPRANFPFNVHFLYGQFDFMNAEAGEKLVDHINATIEKPKASFHRVSEGGHNLYIDNPFETNQLIHQLVSKEDGK